MPRSSYPSSYPSYSLSLYPHTYRPDLPSSLLCRYLVFKKQNNVLLMHVLQTLVRDEMAFADLQRRHRGAIDGSGEEDVEVRVEDLESKARDMEIYDIKPFTDSKCCRVLMNAAEFDPHLASVSCQACTTVVCAVAHVQGRNETS